MVKKLLLLFFVIHASFTYAETIKTDVLVIGNGASAVSAAIQSSRSKLKTVLLCKSDWLVNMQGKSMIYVSARRNLPSGLWGEFRKEVQHFYKQTPGYDTTYNAVLKFEPFAGAGILKKIADTTKNLTIKLNTPYTSIIKNGTGWEVGITVNGKTDYIKAKAIIDATEDGEVVIKAGATIPAGYDDLADNKGELYRTSIAVGDYINTPKRYHDADFYQTSGYYIPIRDVIVNDADNLFITDKVIHDKQNVEYLPIQMGLGQGVAAVAAYCAFFKTTSKNLKVRIIQGELLYFKGYLLPFDDINPTDHYFRSIQQITATGLLKGVRTGNGDDPKFLFMPDSLVNTAEIKPVLTEIYSRAFIWFNNIKPADKFTTGNLLSFISELTLTDPQTLHIAIQKEWKTKYKFTSDFNIDRPITRREFAILANQYLNPFARAIDLNGQMIN